MNWLKRLFKKPANGTQPKQLPPQTEPELTVTELCDVVVMGMEELNRRFPELTLRDDLRGEPQIVDPQFLKGLLLKTYEMAANLKGTLLDKQKLEQLSECTPRILGPEAKYYPDGFYRTLALNLFYCTDDLSETGQEQLPVLRAAYETAQRAKGTRSYEESYDLGRLFSHAAEDLLMSPEEKREAYKTAIRYFKQAVRMGGDNMDYYCLGEAQINLMELGGPDAKELRKIAITNLRKSYELDKDPETLQWVKELENECGL